VRQRLWRRIVRQPQTVWLRRALLQVHLWSGIGVGVYVLMISVTGSVLVYRNELYGAATPKPIISTSSSPRLSDEELTAAALRAYPDFRVVNLSRARNRDQAVDVWLRRGDEVKRRMFDPRTGLDLGDSVSRGIWLISNLLDLHDNLFAGPVGRKVNGTGAAALLLLTITGGVIWWPGIKTWRRSLVLHRRVGWKRFVWELHSVVGFWSLAFILLFAITGLFLCYQEFIADWIDIIQPPTAENVGLRAVDRVTYWLTYLHFGRLGGRGIPWCGRGLCDSTTKAIWAVFGLMPAVMFVTGAIMWWTRVVRPRR